MNLYILRNLRHRYRRGIKDKKQLAASSLAQLPMPLAGASNVNITLNINNFKKPVGAVIQTGGNQDINEFLDIKQED